MTRLALRTLEDVLARANHGPVMQSWGTALALAWLKHVGLLEQWNCEAFWREMAADHEGQPFEYPRYIRTSQLTSTLRCCYLKMGWAEPGCVQRGEWARQYKVGEDA